MQKSKREIIQRSRSTGWFSSKGLKLLFTTHKISNADGVFLWEGVTERESSIPIGCSLSAAAELRLLLKCSIDLKGKCAGSLRERFSRI